MVGGQRSSGQLTLLLRSMISVLNDLKHKFRFVDPQNRPLCLLFESLILFTGLSKTLILGIQPPLIQNLIVAPGMHLSSLTTNIHLISILQIFALFLTKNLFHCCSSRREKNPHYMLPLQRTRSRHDCSFVPGTPFLAGNGAIIAHIHDLGPLNLLI